MISSRTKLRLPAILGATLLFLSGVTSAAGVGACLHHGMGDHAVEAPTAVDHGEHASHGEHSEHASHAGGHSHDHASHEDLHEEPHGDAHDHECDCENRLLCVGGSGVTTTADATPTSAAPPPQRAVPAPASARTTDLPSALLLPFVLPFSNAPPAHV